MDQLSLFDSEHIYTANKRTRNQKLIDDYIQSLSPRHMRKEQIRVALQEVANRFWNGQLEGLESQQWLFVTDVKQTFANIIERELHEFPDTPIKNPQHTHIQEISSFLHESYQRILAKR